MLPEPHIDITIQNYIRSKLSNIEQEYQVKILLAVESGSRAWGFPSEDSDYDVRFIYARSVNDYLSVKDFRDVIETPSLQDTLLGVPLDLNGWDVHKALGLALKSNPVLVEWLVSPIRYYESGAVTKELFAFIQETANLQAFAYHYDRLARNAWEQIQQSSNEVKLKLYCYALRPSLALQWILQFNKLPPMDMPSLFRGLIKDEKLQNEISALFKLKASAKELDLMPRNKILDPYIESCLRYKAEPPSVLLKDEHQSIEKADVLFQKIIKYPL